MFIIACGKAVRASNVGYLTYEYPVYVMADMCFQLFLRGPLLRGPVNNP